MEIIIDGVKKNLFELNSEELEKVNELLKKAFSRNDQKEAMTYYPGVAVSFMHKGRKIYGLVTKVNMKSVSVKTDFGQWNCSPGLLTREEPVKEQS